MTIKLIYLGLSSNMVFNNLSPMFWVCNVCFLLLVSCAGANNNDDVWFSNSEIDDVLRHSIHKKIEYKIGLDTNGNSLWKRVERIQEFKKDGNLEYEIYPRYSSIEYDLSNVDVFTKLKLLGSMSETNIPTGEIDSIKYFYDKGGKLQKEVKQFSQFNQTILYKYNSNGDVIEKCVFADINQFNCRYSNYDYSDNGKIFSRVDSVGKLGDVGQRTNSFGGSVIRYEYQYDLEGRLIFNGEEGRVFDDSNKIVEFYFVSGNGLKEEIISNVYDDENKLVSRNFSKAGGWMTKSNGDLDTTDLKYRVSRMEYFLYDNKGLILQKKEISAEGKLLSLATYEFEFY